MTRTLGYAILGVALLSISQAPVSPQPSGQTQRIAQFENDEVKVWKSIVAPNAPLAMHRHDHPRVIIALAGGKMNIVPESGTPQPNDWETGKAYWLPANPANRLHADVNTGKEPIEVMVVELKRAR